MKLCYLVDRYQICIGICYFLLQSPDTLVLRDYLLLFSTAV
jgi:hypothetical protein